MHWVHQLPYCQHVHALLPIHRIRHNMVSIDTGTDSGVVCGALRRLLGWRRSAASSCTPTAATAAAGHAHPGQVMTASWRHRCAAAAAAAADTSV
jgi:hypothetical protein